MTIPAKLAWAVRGLLLLTLAVLVVTRLRPRPSAVGFLLTVRAHDCNSEWMDGFPTTLHFSPTKQSMIDRAEVSKIALSANLTGIYKIRADRDIYVQFPSDMTTEEVAEYLDLIQSTPFHLNVLLVTPRAFFDCGGMIPPVLNVDADPGQSDDRRAKTLDSHP